MSQQLSESVAYIRSKAGIAPRLGLVLGSGLGDFAEKLSASTVVEASAIPHYPVSTVPGHLGRLVFAVHQTVPVLAFQGRIHFYESNSIRSLLYPLHVAHALGVRTIVITNAAGGINRAYVPGDLMVITGQINLTGRIVAPHSGNESARRGHIYHPGLIARLDEIAVRERIPLRHGVYAGVKGPSYETAAEVEMIHRLGGDAVGMSTVLETGFAVRLGMEVLGISCITNKATGINPEKLNHQEVTEVANKVKSEFTRLLTAFIETC